MRKWPTKKNLTVITFLAYALYFHPLQSSTFKHLNYWPRTSHLLLDVKSYWQDDKIEFEQNEEEVEEQSRKGWGSSSKISYLKGEKNLFSVEWGYLFHERTTKEYSYQGEEIGTNRSESSGFEQLVLQYERHFGEDDGEEGVERQFFLSYSPKLGIKMPPKGRSTGHEVGTGLKFSVVEKRFDALASFFFYHSFAKERIHEDSGVKSKVGNSIRYGIETSGQYFFSSMWGAKMTLGAFRDRNYEVQSYLGKGKTNEGWTVKGGLGLSYMIYEYSKLSLDYLLSHGRYSLSMSRHPDKIERSWPVILATFRTEL